MSRGPAASPRTPLHVLFARHAAERPGRAALTLDGVDTSYGRLNALADHYAAALPLLGARPGDRVMVHAEISVDAVAAVLGILKAGCCVTTTHQTFARAKLVHQIDDADAAVLVTDRAEDLGDLFGDTDLEAVIPLGGGSGGGGAPQRRPRPLRRPRRGPDIPLEGPLAALFYTTGSTADPKGVAISHANMSAAFTAVTGYFENTPDDAVLSFTPIGADFGFYNIMMPLAFGGRAVLHRRLPDRPEQIIETINRDGVTAVHAFPSLLTRLCAAEDLGRHAMPSVRYLCSTGQWLPPGHIAALRGAFPALRIHSMYGLTECKRVCGLPPEEIDRRPGSVGRPIPGVRVTLVDDTGAPVTEPDTVGELAVSGDLVMQGYWRRPELTARVLRTDASGGRTFLTGDLFTRDRDGHLYWRGRKDDAFSRTLLQVDPHEIEALLRGHPDVADAAVVPVPDERAGNVPAACVVLRAGAAARAEELRDFCAERLDWHMVPAAVAFYAELPRTASGKTDRLALRHALARDPHLMADGTEGRGRR
ncbi:class I adenylate-forming enzyme family protein [Streptomyces sp. URMC 123]|uniref:class I adenylate-forming enzyme family protein n=1 Tax=Streptomyces sp. URMC 123 TaxID=3423403 RepID=UPI003F1DF0CC